MTVWNIILFMLQLGYKKYFRTVTIVFSLVFFFN